MDSFIYGGVLNLMSDNHKEHPTPKKYVQIAIFLGVLTAIEVALYLSLIHI